MPERSPRCRGLLGWVCGHKFVRGNSFSLSTYTDTNCFRCGWGPR